MRHKAARIMLWAGVTAVCVLPASGQTTNGGEAAVSQEPVGWGRPQGGLQIGLLPDAPLRELHTGDTLSFALRVRNVGPKPVAYTVRGTGYVSLTLTAGNQLRLQTGTGAAAPLRLAPGAETTPPGGVFRVRLVSPKDAADLLTPLTDAPAPADAPATVAALLPGRYTLECPYPLWIVDGADANSATAHPARAGVLAFTVAGEEPPPAPPGAPSAQWGEAADGLEIGLARDTAAEPADGRDLPLLVFLRNRTGWTLPISSPDGGENDWSFRIRDAQGKDRPVMRTLFSGLIPMTQRVLRPGEVVRIGRVRLRLVTGTAPPPDAVPTLTAEPGKYTVSLVDSLRFTGLNGLDVVLETGALPFDVPPHAR